MVEDNLNLCMSIFFDFYPVMVLLLILFVVLPHSRDAVDLNAAPFESLDLARIR